jgi:hypothetical protein
MEAASYAPTSPATRYDLPLPLLATTYREW